MQGSIQPLKTELLVKDFEIYNGYYCGVCKAIEKRYGTLLRPALSYDFAFFALLLASLEDEDEHLGAEHCLLHPVKKKPVVRGSAVDYAADILILLGREDLRDDITDGDEGPLFAKRAALIPFSVAYKKAAKAHPETAGSIRRTLEDLAVLEEARCGDPDAAAALSGKLLRTAAAGYRPDAPMDQKRALAGFAENIGEWLYLKDALEDYEHDLKRGSYNPYRFCPNLSGRSAENIRKTCGEALYDRLGKAVLAYELLDIRKNKRILDNILYLGLRKISDEIVNSSFSEKKEKKKWQ